MIYIGLDISTKTGIAIIEPHPKGKTILTSLITSKNTGMKRADDIAWQIHEFIEQAVNFKGSALDKKKVRVATKPYKIIIEGYGFARTQNLIPLIEVGTVVRYTLYEQGFSYIEVPPTSLKKFVTGKGNVKKEMMLKEVYKRWNIDCDTNDEADAVGLAYMGMALDGKLKLPKINMEALKKITIDKETVST